jgi:hypothetical protein
MAIATQITKEQLFVGHDTETGALFTQTDAELDVQIRRLPAFQDIMTSLADLRNRVTRNQEMFVDHRTDCNQDNRSMKQDIQRLDKNSLVHTNHIELIKKQGDENKKTVKDFCMKFKKETDAQNKDMQQVDTEITELKEECMRLKKDIKHVESYVRQDIAQLTEIQGQMQPYLAWPTYWDVDNKKYDRVPSCIICEARPRNVIWFPCKHVLMCEKCSDDAVYRDPQLEPKCYICPQHYIDHKVIDWRFVGKHWDQENPRDEDHQHFFLSGRFQTIE